MAKLAIALLCIFSFVLMANFGQTEARSANSNNNSNLAEMKDRIIDTMADMMVGFMDRSLGSQARSMARQFAGINSHDALKV